MPTTTSRLTLTQPAGTDGPSALRTAITANATTLDSSVQITEGVLASRPAAGTVPYGNVYYATDTGVYYQSNGTAWATVLVAGAWQSVVLGTNFGSAPSPYYAPAARLEGDLIRFRGTVVNTAGVTLNLNSGVPLLTLPPGLRPVSTVGLAIAADQSVSGPLYVTVNAAGIMAFNNSPATMSTSGHIYLDGLTFTIS